MMEIKNFIFDLFFPIHCLGCGREKEFICSDCLERIPITNFDFEEINQTDLRKIIIASDYENFVLKQAVYKYKYDFVKDLAKPLGQLMVKKMLMVNVIARPDASCLPSGRKRRGRGNPVDILLIPVPLHKKRLRWRGFNQAELLTREISAALNIPVINNLLIRKKYTHPQMKIHNSQARQKNIKEAFDISKNYQKLVIARRSEARFAYEAGRATTKQSRSPIQNKTIILIDDICTTGATLNECAKILRPLKPKNIYGLVLARG